MYSLDDIVQMNREHKRQYAQIEENMIENDIHFEHFEEASDTLVEYDTLTKSLQLLKLIEMFLQKGKTLEMTQRAIINDDFNEQHHPKACQSYDELYDKATDYFNRCVINLEEAIEL
jgi:hypothetical protein